MSDREQQIHDDVFNPAESDFEYFERRRRELAPVAGSPPVLLVEDRIRQRFPAGAVLTALGLAMAAPLGITADTLLPRERESLPRDKYAAEKIAAAQAKRERKAARRAKANGKAD